MLHMPNSFTEQYDNLLEKINCLGIPQINKRTNTLVLTSPSPEYLNIYLNTDNLPLPGNRTIYPKVAAAEVAWQFMGIQDPEFIMKHAPKIWGKFIDKDNKIEAAYGYRWSQHFYRNQIQLALDALRKDSTNRQIYISAWDAKKDGLGNSSNPKNIPCPVGFTVNIINNKLNIAVNMRSSDVYVGLPYDVLTYSLMLDAFATSLSCERGYLSFQLAHAHIYGPHIKNMRKDLSTKPKGLYLGGWPENLEAIPFPNFSIEKIIEKPDEYVEYFKQFKIRKFNDVKPDVIE